MKYRKYNVRLEFNNYTTNNNNAISMFGIEDNELIAVCSVNINEILERDEVAIKDYSENSGMLKWLIENNIVELPYRFTTSGFVMIPICKLKGGNKNGL